MVRCWPWGRQERGYGSSGPRGLAGRQAGLLGRRDGSGAQVPSSGFAARPRWSAPHLGQHSHHPSAQAAVAARDPRSSAEDPLPGAGAFVPLTDPLCHAGQRESPRPVPASSQLRSHDQVSITLKVGAALGADDQAERDVLSASLTRGHPPRAKLTSAHNVLSSRTRSKSQHHAVSLRGLRVTLAFLRPGALGSCPEGGIGSQKSQQFSTLL